MNKKQTASILAVLSSAYPNSFESDKNILETWFQLLRKEDFEAVKSVVMDYLGKKKPFPPTVSEIAGSLKAAKGPQKKIKELGNGWKLVSVQAIDDKGEISTHTMRVCACTETERLKERLKAHEKGLLYVEQIRDNGVIYYFADNDRDLRLIRNNFYEGQNLPVFEPLF